MVSTPWKIWVKNGNLSQVGVNHLEYFNRTWIEGIFSKDFPSHKRYLFGERDMWNDERFPRIKPRDVSPRHAQGNSKGVEEVLSDHRTSRKQQGFWRQLLAVWAMPSACWNDNDAVKCTEFTTWTFHFRWYFPYRVSIHHLLGFNWHLEWKVLVYRHWEVDFSFNSLIIRAIL